MKSLGCRVLILFLLGAINCLPERVWAVDNPPDNPVILNVFVSSISVTYGLVGADGYVVDASTKSIFEPVWSSSSSNVAVSTLAPQGLDPNTTYYLRAGALWDPTTYYANTTPESTSTLANQAEDTQVYKVYITSITVNWKPLPTEEQEGSSSTCEGYVLQASTKTNFVPLWDSSSTTGVSLSTLTIGNLTGDNTYYFRVGSLNWNNVPNYAVRTSTFLSIQLGVYLSTNTLILPGLTNMDTILVISTSIIVTNTGNVNETYSFQATTTTAGSPWKLDTTQDVDQFVLWGVINSTEPATIDFGTEDKIVESDTECDGDTVYTMGNQTGVSIPPGETRTFWLQLGTPKASSTGDAQEITITATAAKSP